MMIKVLVDNSAAPGFESAHGLSLWVEADRKVLFDTGPSDLFVRNAQIMGVDLKDADAIVLSHGHWDHGKGLEYLEGLTLVTHPTAFVRRFRSKDFSYIGLSIDRNAAHRRFRLTETIEPFWLSDQMVFLGEIPRVNDFESKTTPFVLENNEPDYVPDDSALVVRHTLGLVIISGCAHAGICNTVDYARYVCGEERVLAVLGGFHLKEMDEVSHRVIGYLKECGVEMAFPIHCSSPHVILEFNRVFGNPPLQTGSTLEL